MSGFCLTLLHGTLPVLRHPVMLPAARSGRVVVAQGPEAGPGILYVAARPLACGRTGGESPVTGLGWTFRMDFKAVIAAAYPTNMIALAAEDAVTISINLGFPSTLLKGMPPV